MLISRHHFFNWIKNRTRTPETEPVQLFSLIGHLNHIMNALDSEKEAAQEYGNQEVKAARALMQISNEAFLTATAQLGYQQVALSNEGMQVLRWFKERQQNGQANLVSNLSFLTEIRDDSKALQVSNWDRQTVGVARIAQQLSNDELFSILSRCQCKAGNQSSAWGADYPQLFEFKAFKNSENNLYE
ncbi:hypothetical protein ACLJJ6_07015 [Pediococcus siamensis]|uniref:hypothetical protein n=1 Tax=Pediococcus siamensis TaxID=381829 RepID=UPI0039A2841D